MMNCYYLKCLGGDVYIYELKHCLSDILLRHSILQLRMIVIFDNFVVFSGSFAQIAYYYVINLIRIYNSWVYLCGTGCLVGSNVLPGSLLCGGPCYSTQDIPWKCH